MVPGKLLRLAAVIVYAGTAALASSLAKEQDQAPLPPDPAEFVRQAVAHELNAMDNDHTRWMYRLHKEDEKNSQDRQVIETKDGSLSKVLLFNGQPLTLEQRQQDQERMRRLVEDPEERARRNKRERSDAEKARTLLKGIPEAFHFAYDGTQDNMVRVNFVPNPQYSPPTREMTVYHSMKGTLWIDRTAVRLAQIEGQLFEDVNFGWGLLGHLDKGGTFKVHQKEVGPGHWETVLVDLNLHGRAVVFKTIAVKQRQTFSDFRRMPDDLTLTKALEMLQKSDDGATARTQNQASQVAQTTPATHQ